MKLSEIVENPDNPSVVTDEAFERLLRKVKRLPEGLKADRIAFVTDHPAGKYVVLSGNKRLRCLKKILGDDGEAPDDCFQDITSMSEAARREFIVSANVNEGQWVSSMLVAMYSPDELRELMDGSAVMEILAGIPREQTLAENRELDQSAFEDVVILKVKLPPAAKERCARILAGIDEDPGVALMKIIRGAA